MAVQLSGLLGGGVNLLKKGKINNGNYQQSKYNLHNAGKSCWQANATSSKTKFFTEY